MFGKNRPIHIIIIIIAASRPRYRPFLDRVRRGRTCSVQRAARDFDSKSMPLIDRSTISSCRRRISRWRVFGRSRTIRLMKGRARDLARPIVPVSGTKGDAGLGQHLK